MSRTRSIHTWLTAAAACVLGVALSVRCARSSAPAPRPALARAPGAYRPHAPHPEAARPVVPGTELEPLTPDLEHRLAAAMTVMTVPATRPPGSAALVPPTGPVSGEAAVVRHTALMAWQANAQRHLDRCVARPEALRQQVALEVIFAPAPSNTGYLDQALVPAVLAAPAAALRRLWRDTDPDALQRCLDDLRAAVLAVPPVRDEPARPLPAAAEIVIVQL